jgi:hypothetical protein
MKLKLLFALLIVLSLPALGQVPDSPVLVEPPNITTSVTTTPQLIWTDVNLASAYELQVSAHANFATVLPLQASQLTSSSFHVPNGSLSSNTKYYWRVKAKNNNGQSNYSNAFWFKTAGTYQQELLTIFQNVFNLILNNYINFSYGSSLSQKIQKALEKTIQHNFDDAISKVNEFKSKLDEYTAAGYISQQNALPLTATANGIIALLQGDNNPAVNSTNPLSFILEQNYPNPFNPVTAIRYSIPEASNVTLKIYDLSGKLVSVLVDENQQPGIYNIMWNASGLSSGVYLYILTSGNYKETRKLVLAK